MRRTARPRPIERLSSIPGIEPQAFSKEADRERLSPVALKAYVNLAKAWKLSNGDAAALLGVSGSSWDRIKRGQRPILNQDQLMRMSAIIGLYKGLHLLLGDEVAADSWPTLPNTGPLFQNRTPVEAMVEGGIPHMLDVRGYVDAVRGGL